MGSPHLLEGAKRRAAAIAGSRLTSEGEIVITASSHRTQAMNRDDALNRLAARSNAVLLGTVPAGEGGTGDMRLVIDKEAAGDTGSLVFQVGASGRAEIGLAGGEDFSIKVSPDGVSWFTAMTIDRATGVVSFPAGVAE